jgi:peptidyl-dipeptidase Dcp
MKKVIIILAIIMAVVSCNRINPFFEEWENEYGIPDFGKIEEKHYIPAIEFGILQQQSEIDAIIANSEDPTFENVVVAYEKSSSPQNLILNSVPSFCFIVTIDECIFALYPAIKLLIKAINRNNFFLISFNYLLLDFPK